MISETFASEDQTCNSLTNEGHHVEVQDASQRHDDRQCGFGACHPPCFRHLARIGCFTGFYSINALLTSTLTAYVISQVTTLERQFGFNSKDTALIVASNDIGNLLFVLFLSYIASKVHIPRALASMTFLFGVSSLICALPHFLYGHNTNQDLSMTPSMTSDSLANQSTVLKDQNIYGQLCQYENRSLLDSCQGSDVDTKASPSLRPDASLTSLVIIVLGMLLQGIGKAPRLPLTITYIDNNTEKVKTGFYVGVIIAVAVFGPALAFTMGGWFSNIYVTLKETNLHPRHPRWIGAWWLGYVVIGGITTVASLPLLCFPRRMPHQGQGRQPEVKAKNVTCKGKDADKPPNQMARTDDRKRVEGQKYVRRPRWSHFHEAVGQVKGFVLACCRLWTNPVYMLLALSNVAIVFAVAGPMSFGPKYLEIVFDLPAQKANYIKAAEMLVAGCLGTLIGGYLSKRWKLTALTGLKFMICTVSMNVLLNIPRMFIYCDQPQTYNNPWSSPACASDCHCEDNSYFPVCGDDGRTYYSPCAAGCQTSLDGNYQNCTCIGGGEAKSGVCHYTCHQVYYYAVGLVLQSFSGSLSIASEVTVMIRSVGEQDKSLAVGFIVFMSGLFGWLVGSSAFGAYVDGVCVIWDSTCGVTGRCLLYDNNQFRFGTHGFQLTGEVIRLTCLVTALAYAKRTGFLDEAKGEDVSLSLLNGGQQTKESDEEQIAEKEREHCNFKSAKEEVAM